MFLTDAQAALNDLIADASESLDHYEEAQTLTDNSHLQATFQRIQEDRHPLLMHLQDVVKHDMHMLPKAPNQEREELAALLTRLQASVEGHKDQVLWQDRVNAEEHLKQRIHAATEHPLPPPVQMSLYELASQVAEAEERLEAVRHHLQCEHSH